MGERLICMIVGLIFCKCNPSNAYLFHLRHCLLLWRHHKSTLFWPWALHHPAPRPRRRIHGRHIETWWLQTTARLRWKKAKMFRAAATLPRGLLFIIFVYYYYYRNAFTLVYSQFYFSNSLRFCVYLVSFCFSLLLILFWNNFELNMVLLFQF